VMMMTYSDAKAIHATTAYRRAVIALVR
jgi:hypothetical protein